MKQQNDTTQFFALQKFDEHNGMHATKLQSTYEFMKIK